MLSQNILDQIIKNTEIMAAIVDTVNGTVRNPTPKRFRSLPVANPTA
jgi:hypothetical protein